MTILIDDTIDFKSKTVARDKEGHYVTIRDSVHQWKVKIVSIWILEVPKHKKGCYKRRH